MKIQTVKNIIKTPLFTDAQVQRVFSTEPCQQISVQLGRWVKQGHLIRLRRGLYKIADREVDELTVASWLYQPSYVSLESALNLYGIIPDVPQRVTSVSTTTSRRYETPLGIFTYSKVKTSLFFGYNVQKNEVTGLTYNLAEPAKAVLDYIYLRHITRLDEARLSLDRIKQSRLRTFAQHYPTWVVRVVLPK